MALLYIRNPEEDPNLPIHPDSLCALLEGQTVDNFCPDCRAPATFVAASAVDFTLKQLEDDIYYRERLAAFPPACGPVTYATEAGEGEGFTGTELVLDTWLPLSSSHCTGINSITGYQVPVEDMPLNHAIYDASRDVIFAVRSGYIFKMNATTGAIISSARYAYPGFEDVYVALDPGTDKLFATSWMTYADQNQNVIADRHIKKLVKIDPDTLVVDDTFIYSNIFTNRDEFEAGPREIIALNSLIYGLWCDSAAGTNLQIYTFDPVGETWNNTATFNGNGQYGKGIAFDSAQNFIWGSSSTGANAYDLSLTGTDTNNVTVPRMVRGIAYRLTGTKLYYTVAVAGALTPQHVISITTAETNETVIDTGVTSAFALRIRYRDTNDRIYVPTWGGDSVVIIDPTTDTVESVKTGFDSPVDVVFTPTKAWAVQWGSVGLKEIV